MSPVERSDAIRVVGDWISEHFFTTDSAKESFKARVLAQRAAWEEERDQSTPRTRLTASRQGLLGQMVTIAGTDDPQERRESSSALNAEMATVLGFGAAGQRLVEHGPVQTVTATGLGEPAIAVISAICPAVDGAEPLDALLAKDADALTEPWVSEETGEEIRSVGRLLSALFVSGEPRPAFALVLAGRWAVVAERERWPEGRYLAVDLQLVLERADDRRGGELDRALCCVAADALVSDAEGAIWWASTLEASARHTVGVSKDLRDGIRQSIEIIANEVVQRRAAHGLEPLPSGEAQPLAKQALRFLYRILFLLYAEASPELGVLPVRAPEYERGYSLDRLRDLTLVELASLRAQQGTHLYASLAKLFELVDQGHEPGRAEHAADGLRFQPLRADLFLPRATAHIDAVGLGNAAMQEVLEHLLLSKASGKRDRGFISYAELGINQLGAVYEGLMSYTGFFAQDDLFEVANSGDAEKGSWVVPVSRFDEELRPHLVMTSDELTGEPRPVVHPKGSFVYRLSGRDRQQSASYYTPEVLTRFVVSQALEELLDQDVHTTTAREILELTICEPALGSGAFAIEAVRQLAEEYLRRRQAELGEQIDPDAYARELQKVKAHIALHQVYGVDLNPTAVELAEISLWLDTMVEGLQAPWFGLRLRAGNSLIGAQRAVYSTAQLPKGRWLKEPPTAIGTGVTDRSDMKGAIPHFLLPSEGWGAAADVAKEIRELTPERVIRLKGWRREMRRAPTKKQQERLVDLGQRVEQLWDLAARRLAIAEEQTRRPIPLWGRGPSDAIDALVSREEIERSLSDEAGAYRRLRRAMDAWCALWFWPLTRTAVEPPSLEQWIDAMEALLGLHDRKAEARGQLSLGAGTTWESLGATEARDLEFALAQPVDRIRADHPWLGVCEDLAEKQRFFHWQLDFSAVFERRGGFDLQVGNPPWVRPRSDVDALRAEADPWWKLVTKPTQEKIAERLPQTYAFDGARELVIDETASTTVVAAVIGHETVYPVLRGLQPDLYRAFMAHAWAVASPRGVTSLIHPESHFTDEKAGELRRETYRRLRRHWQFVNELQLFEIHNLVTYGVHVYRAAREPSFQHATSLYHPETVERSLLHDGSGPEPGLKTPDGAWDLRPHKARLQRVARSTLATWHELLENEAVPVQATRMVYTVNRAAAEVLATIAKAPRMASLDLQFSSGWHEKSDRTKGRFESEWGRPDSWDDVILQGPHLHVGNPFYKSPNATMSSNKDWSPVDLEALSADAIPVTSYKPRGDRAIYDATYTQWASDQGPTRASATYRLAYRAMAAPTGERTLIVSLVPPGPTQVNTVFAFGDPGHSAAIVIAAAVAASLLSDFSVRVAPTSNIYRSVFERVPMISKLEELESALADRVLRLNCLTSAYSELWGKHSEDVHSARAPLLWRGTVGPVTWTADVPLRRAADRRQALLEIDVLVALGLGVAIDQLCTIYRTQFPVLYGYDRHRDRYDANGRLVPNSVITVWRKKGDDAITLEERTATNPSGNTYVYELPFRTLDREADMRAAYAHFERLLAEHGDG